MEPTTAAMIAKAAIAVGTNKKVWTGIASVIAALCLPFILIIVCILCTVCHWKAVPHRERDTAG